MSSITPELFDIEILYVPTTGSSGKSNNISKEPSSLNWVFSNFIVLSGNSINALTSPKPDNSLSPNIWSTSLCSGMSYAIWNPWICLALSSASTTDLINAEPTTVSSSENSKETVSPSLSVAVNVVIGSPTEDSILSPLWLFGVNCTVPQNSPVSLPVSISLYWSNSSPLVETFTGLSLVLPISSTNSLSRLCSGAVMVMYAESVQRYTFLSNSIVAPKFEV